MQLSSCLDFNLNFVKHQYQVQLFGFMFMCFERTTVFQKFQVKLENKPNQEFVN